MTKQTLLVLLLSIILSFAIFGNGIRAEFTYDDGPGIQTRVDIKDPRNIFSLFVSPYYFQQPEIGLYRPLPMLTYLLNYSIFGSSPVSFHILNILLHAVSSYLIFILIRFLTKSFKLAFFTFLLFLTHPIHAEAVSLIVGRAEILAFMFSILVIYLHLTKRYFWANISFGAALFSKEIAVMTIPLLFYIEFMQNGKFPKVTRYLFYVVPLSFYFLLRHIALGKFMFYSEALNFVENPLPFVSFGERILTAFKVLYLYIEKLFYPAYLTNDYSFDIIKIVKNPLTSPQALLGIGLFVVLVSLCVFPKTRKTPLGLGASIFLLPYLLVSNFILTVGTIMAERLVYFSSLGFCIIIAYALVKLTLRYKFWKEAPWIILIFIVVLFGIRTIVRNEDWINNDRLYTVNLKNHPEGFLTQLYWGTSLAGKTQLEKAKKHLMEANKIYPNNPKLITTFGTLAEIEGQPKKAEELYKRALEKYNLSIEAYSRLGYLYYTQERYEEAAIHLLKAITLYPNPSDVSYYARTQIQLRKPEKGIVIIHKYFGYNPEDAEVVTALGYSYYIREDYTNALNYLLKSKEFGNINPEIESMLEVSRQMTKGKH